MRFSNDVGNVSIALANGETLPIQGTGTVSLPPLSCGQVMGDFICLPYLR